MKNEMNELRCNLPRLELCPGGVHVTNDVAHVTDDGSKHENSNKERQTGKHVLLKQTMRADINTYPIVCVPLSCGCIYCLLLCNIFLR